MVIDAHLPTWLSLRRTLYLLTTMALIAPLLHRHRQQRRLPRQHLQTGWLKTAHSIVSDSFFPETWPLPVEAWDNNEDGPPVDFQRQFLSHVENLVEFLGWNHSDHRGTLDFFTDPPPILVTRHTHYQICPNHPFLFREGHQIVTVHGANFRRAKGHLVIAHCTHCKAKYFPDIITKKVAGSRRRVQLLEGDPEWLRISKHGVWAHRKVALLQKEALAQFRGTWQRFRLFFNKSFGNGADTLTERQTHRLFTEFLIRLLLQAHGRLEGFECPSFVKPSVMIEAALEILGRGGGSVPGAKDHECADCLHEKKYREVHVGAELEAGRSAFDVADYDSDGDQDEGEQVSRARMYRVTIICI